MNFQRCMLFLEPVCPLFLGFKPSKRRPFTIKKRGHLGSRYTYPSGWSFPPKERSTFSVSTALRRSSRCRRAATKGHQTSQWTTLTSVVGGIESKPPVLGINSSQPLRVYRPTFSIPYIVGIYTFL